MFGSIFGLPLHILVIHLVVVLGPIAGFMVIAYAVRPAWRDYLTWPTLIVTTVAGLASIVAGQSGEALQHRLEQRGLGASQLQLINSHVEAGNAAKILGVLFMVVTWAVIWLVLSPGLAAGKATHVTDPMPTRRQFSPTVRTISAVGLVVMALAFIVAVTIAGHLGAVASWKGIF